MTYTNQKNILVALAIACAFVVSAFTFVAVARADGFSNDFQEFAPNNFQEFAQNDFQEFVPNNFQEFAQNDFQPYAQNNFEPYTNNFEPYSTASYDIYNIYGVGGYPYYGLGGVYGYPGFGGYGFGGGSSFNFGLYYSNVRTPTYASPVVYSAPIVYSTPTYITSPSYAYVTSVTQTIPQYNVQAYVPAYNYAAPSCSITASNSNANYNYYNYSNNFNNYNYNNYNSGQTLLTWYSNNANSAYISPSVGSVSTSGSATVYPYGNQTYTLTVSGPGGTTTCQTYAYNYNYNYAYTAPTQPVYYYSNYTAPTLPVYQPPTAPYVALTQIPYTGYDFGPVGNAIYWMSLVLFAIAGAYLVVYYLPAQAGRGGGLSFLNDFLGADGPQITATPVRSEVRAEEVIKRVESVASARRSNAPFGTKDAMTVEKSSNGNAPRIVIVRA